MPGDRLYMLPGLGADERMFYPQRAALPEMKVVGWIEPRPGESLAEYARRMAQRVVDESAAGPVWLGGVSMGGMVALEMSRHARAAGVILVSSCRSGSCVPMPHRIAERVSRWLPDRSLGGLPSLTPLIVPYLSEADQGLFRRMLADTPIDFIRWAGRAVIEWRGDAPRCPVHQIHGEHDRILPLRRLGHPPDIVVAGAHHLLNLTHPTLVNRFIRDRLAGGNG